MSPDITTTWHGAAVTPSDQRRTEAAIHRGIHRGIATARGRRRPTTPTRRPAPVATTANRHHDVLYVGAQPPVRVLMADALHLAYRTADPSQRVETDSVVRALHWGSALFGATGFVVRRERDKPGRFSALPLTSPLAIADVGGFAEQDTDIEAPEGIIFYNTRLRFEFDHDSGAILAVTREGNRLYRQGRRLHPNDTSGETIARQYQQSLRSGDVVTPTELLDFADRLVVSSNSPVERLLSFDQRAFAAMSMVDRGAWLALLVDAASIPVGGPDVDQIHHAILRLVRTCDSRAELEALFAPLGPAGVAALFARFDSATFELLVTLGGFVGPEPVDVNYLEQVITEQRESPLSEHDSEESLATVWDWAANFAGSFRELPKLPTTLVDAAPHLYRLYQMVSHATGSDLLTGLPVEIRPDDRAALRELVTRLGRTLRTALAGAHYAERLGAPRGAVGGLSVGRKIVRRVKYLLLLEAASAAIGAGELKAVAGEARQGTTWVVGLLLRLRGAKAVLTAEEIARAGRLLTALGGVVGVADAEHAARLVKLLPNSFEADLAHLIDNAPPRALTFDTFRTMAGNKEPADRIAHALDVVRLVEQKTGGSAGLTEDVVAGLHRLLETGDSTNWQQLAWLEKLSDQDLPAVLRFAARWSPYELAEVIGRADVVAYATSKAVTAFLDRAGTAALRDIIRTFEAHPKQVVPLLERLEPATAGITDPAEYLEFVDRLRRGDAAALVTVAGQGPGPIGNAARRLRSGGSRWAALQEELGLTLRETDASFTVFDKEAAFLDGLADHELDGLERLAGLDRRSPKRIPGTDSQSERFRGWGEADRRQLLGLIGDLDAYSKGRGRTPVLIEGMDRVLSALLRDSPKQGPMNAAQGAWGHLYAVRDLIERDGALAMRLEVDRAGRRIDIRARLRGLDAVEVEVKTNLTGDASMIANQVRSDLRHHALTYGGFSRLRYRYNELSEPLFGEVKKFFLAQFDEALIATLPRRRRKQRARLRASLQLWLETGGVDFYRTK
ncbi:hypothetical protein [Kutzneria kofuensis]|uniref:Uncharacterized protein n=1 Tax=Kutzneria kofuensis TaxID=103725 RepID=A0A7W9NKI3_9PSEU|nr:hypothetical protein [Kutzneria kofuensis]MBB5896060.1 hypothetical protein [Kutzneria kofuensis]